MQTPFLGKSSAKKWTQIFSGVAYTFNLNTIGGKREGWYYVLTSSGAGGFLFLPDQTSNYFDQNGDAAAVMTELNPTYDWWWSINVSMTGSFYTTSNSGDKRTIVEIYQVD